MSTAFTLWHTYTLTHTSTHARTHTHTQAHTEARTHTQLTTVHAKHAHIPRARTHTHTDTHKHTNTRAGTHTPHARTHTTHTLSLSLSPSPYKLLVPLSPSVFPCLFSPPGLSRRRTYNTVQYNNTLSILKKEIQLSALYKYRPAWK